MYRSLSFDNFSSIYTIIDIIVYNEILVSVKPAPVFILAIKDRGPVLGKKNYKKIVNGLTI